MSRKPTPKRTRPKPKAILRLPDLDQAKAAVLNSLSRFRTSGKPGSACISSGKRAADIESGQTLVRRNLGALRRPGRHGFILSRLGGEPV